jgi:Mg-chelatase subunit ChlD
VKAVQKGWDERSVNSVVVFTDGANDKSGGLSLTDLTRAMTAQARSGRPIPVFGIGIGPDVDLEALRAFCRASGGKAYQVNSAAEIRSALIDGLALRYSGG